MYRFELMESPNPSNPFNLSILSEHSEHFKRVKHFEPLGLFPSRRNARGGKRIEPIEMSYNSRMSKTRRLKELTGLTCLKEHKGVAAQTRWTHRRTKTRWAQETQETHETDEPRRDARDAGDA